MHTYSTSTFTRYYHLYRTVVMNYEYYTQGEETPHIYTITITTSMQYDRRTVSRLSMIALLGCVYLVSALLVSSTTAVTTSSSLKSGSELQQKCTANCKTGVTQWQQEDSTDGANILYPLKTVFVKVPAEKEAETIHLFSQHGLYHKYLTIHKIESAYCLGHMIVLRVTTDNTTIFNPSATPWPTRPETEWVFQALNGNISNVIFIHYRSYFVTPDGVDGDDGREDPTVVYKA